MSYSGAKNEVARLTAVVPGEYMSQIALFIKHRTLPGKRDEVRGVWEQHMAPAIAANPGHTAYFYCYDNVDPDVICAFQQYASAEAARSFLQNDSYLAYLKDVEPLLSGSPEAGRQIEIPHTETTCRTRSIDVV